ncbi:MAG: transcriptional regulator with GAF, ATPase, and Fis domain, partial [Myxococcota bacterium]
AALQFLSWPVSTPGVTPMGNAIGTAEARPTWLFTVRDQDGSTAPARDILSSTPSHAIAPLNRTELAKLISSPDLIKRLGQITDFRRDRLRQLVALLPESLDELAQLPLAGLSGTESECLRWLAHVSRPLGATELAELATTSRIVVERVVAQGFLQRTALGLKLAPHWVGPVTESVAPLSPHEHARCADALASASDCDSVLARANHRRLADDNLGFKVDLLVAVDSLLNAGRLERAAEVAGLGPADDPEFARRLVTIDVRLGRLTEALAHCQSLRGANVALDLQAAHLLRVTGDLKAAEASLSELLSHPLPVEIERRATLELATARLRRGDLDGCADVCVQADALNAEAAPKFRAAFENVRGHIAYRRADWPQAETHYRTAAETADDPKLRGAALHNLGLVALAMGDYRGAAAKLQRAIGAIDAGGDHVQAAGASHNLGIAWEHLHQYSLAAEQFRSSIEMFQRLGERSRLANAISSLADLHLTLGETWRANKLLAHVRELAEEDGQAAVTAIALRRLARAELMDERPNQAKALAKDALQRLEKLGHGIEIERCWLLIAEIGLARDDRKGAQLALASVRGSDDRELRARGLLVTAELEGQHDPAEGARIALQASETFDALCVRDGLVEALAIAARLSPNATGAALEERAKANFDELLKRVPALQHTPFRRTPAGRAIARLETPIVAPMVHTLVQAPKIAHAFHRLVGECPAMMRVFEMTRRVANSSAPILVLGESGTGKELVAEAIHLESSRTNGPFVRVNAAAFVDSLLESELFGHERGAFTGAHSRRVGAFELAHRGTLFLDEIGDITPRTQVALLRALQEGEIRRVGGTRTVSVDVRVLCATNHDLEQRVADGHFRLDLYYRIRGVTLELPALRDRGDDLARIARHLLSGFGDTAGLTLDALELLSAHDWPGNVRELENILQTGHFFAAGAPITAEILRRSTSLGAQDAAKQTSVDHEPIPEGFDLKAAQRELEITNIVRALKQTGGNITRAADLLGFKRPRLSQKIKEYELRSYLGKPS